MGFGSKTIAEGFRISPQQRDLWTRLRGNAGWNRAVAVIRIEGSVNPNRLSDAWREVVERHEILHATYRSLPGMTEPMLVLGDAVMGWEQERSGADDSDGRALALEALRDEQDLAAAPVSSLRLISHRENLHTLLLSLPAMSADWRSLGELVELVARTYHAHREGEDISGEEVFQYTDIAEWANEELTKDSNPDGLRFWKPRRHGLPPDPAPPLATHGREQSRPTLSTYQLPRAMVSRLESVARDVQSDPEAVLLACWVLLLGRLSGQRELAVSLGLAGRSYEELHHALGRFSRYVPFRLLLDVTATFDRLVKATAAQWGELEGWQEFFAWHGEDHGEVPPAFAFEAWRPPSTIQAAGLSWRFERAAIPAGGFAARLMSTFSEKDLTLDLYSDSARLPEGGDLLLERFVDLLGRVLADFRRPLTTFSPLTEREQEERVARSSGESCEVPEGFDVVERLRHYAESAPDDPAVVFEQVELSYRDLDCASHALADALRAQGIAAGEVVALDIERSETMIVALLAVLRAGGTYLPLDLTTPAARRASMLEDAGAVLVLGSGDCALPLPADCRWLDLDALAATTPSSAPETLPVANLPAYVLFTSGSTGRPKGVIVGRDRLNNYVYALTQRLGLSEGTSFATVSTLAADLGNTAIFSALCLGGAVHVVAEERLTDAEALAELFRDRPVDCLKIVPSHLRALLGTAAAADLLPRRCLISGGEALHWDLVDAIRDLRTGCRVVNHYGPTESTVGATVFEVPEDGAPALRKQSATVPIGRPLANLRALVVDEGGGLVAPGREGQLHLAGAGLAQGYCGRPRATASSFLPDPLSGVGGERWYRTGDRVRLLPDGLLEYLGRVDGQLKIRGHRVEPGEVETVLRHHPGLATAAVVPVGEGSDVSLGALLVPDPVTARPVHRWVEMESQGLLREVETATLPDGTDVFHIREQETLFLWEELFERRGYLDHGVELWPGACVFDVGANIGMFSLFASREAPGGRIIAIEPVPPLARIVDLNARLHGIDGEVLACGVKDKPGELEITYFPRMSMLSSFHGDRLEVEREMLRSFLEREQQQSGHEGVTGEQLDRIVDETLRGTTYDIPVKTLSQLFRQTGVERVDLLKLDVQHSELEALRGIDESDWPRIGQVIVEVYAADGHQQVIEELLSGQGFDVQVARGSESGVEVCMIFARRPSWARRAAEGEAAKSRWQGREALLASVREHLEQQLPEPMLPTAFGWLAQLPLNANGKIDRRALPELSKSSGQDRADYREPASGTEKALAALWAEVLQVARVGADDDFFALGGHSLLATRLISRIRSELQATISLRDFFDAPTVARLAAVIDAAGKSEPAVPKLQARSRESYRRKPSSS
jgi:amino acid adenylation domain-containing protein/FkbM family methyltransferase